MTALAFILGTALCAIPGWFALRCVEGRAPVLSRWERLVLGWMAGSLACTSAAFTAQASLGVPFSAVGFLGSWAVLSALSIGMFHWMRKQNRIGTANEHVHHERMRNGASFVLALLLVWTAMKIFMGMASLSLSPVFFDDTINNWNMRGKLYFFTQRYELSIPLTQQTSQPDPLSSYPPLVPLQKTWLNALHGTWSEPLANGAHALWFVAAIAIVFFVLRRLTSDIWACLGIYALVSLPLYLVQGSSAYTDVCMSAYIAVPVLFFALALREQHHRERALTFLRISGAFAGLLGFVKNEGLIMYLPVFVAVGVVATFFVRNGSGWTRRDALRHGLLPLVATFVLFCGPWLAFKMAHHMPFGNAKSVTGLALGWHNNVLYSILINTFFEGNWLLLFPLFSALLLCCWRTAFRGYLLPVTVFVLFLYVSQVLLFLFTSLATEALMQTGYARGIIHLAPLIIVITAVLAAEAWKHIRRGD